MVGDGKGKATIYWVLREVGIRISPLTVRKPRIGENKKLAQAHKANPEFTAALRAICYIASPVSYIKWSFI